MEFKDYEHTMKDLGWHKVFAWFPVTVGYQGETAWLQNVERKLESWWRGALGIRHRWSYRLKEGAPEVTCR